MNEYMPDVIKLLDLKQNIPLNQIVYNGLRTSIIKGIIPLGERINEKKYSLELNVSRTPIRDALYRLHVEGLIEHIPNCGYLVKKITLDDAKEIYKIRIALDILAAKNAMNKMTNEKFKEMKNLLNYTEEMEQQGNVEEVIKLFSDFNNMIYEYSNMPRLKTIIYNLRDYLARFRNISLLDDYRRRKAFDEHKLIYYCLKEKDEHEITTLIHKHLEYSEKFVLAKMQQLEENNNESTTNI